MDKRKIKRNVKNSNQMSNRRDFLKQMAVASIMATLPSNLFAEEQQRKNGLIWAYLLHLSYNMWNDTVSAEYRDENYPCTTCEEAVKWAIGYQPFLTFDEEVYNILLKKMAEVGFNMIVIDLGDAVRYESHPEIAVRNAWSPEKLRAELTKMRKLGLEPIPKLNFSTSHDTWLGEYGRMVSSKMYYKVCRDLIAEVIELFDTPRFFHLGMDEETIENQKVHNYVTLRQNDLWWGDLYFYLGEVEKKGVRGWVWSDYAWENSDIFFKKMPRSVIQSNWYYRDAFDEETMKKPFLKLYDDLDKYGFDQIPTGSNHYDKAQNMELTVDHCKKVIDPSRLLGFMEAPWRPTLKPCLDRHLNAIAQMERAMKKIN